MKRPIKFRGYDTDYPMAGTVTFTLEDLLAESESYGLVHPDSIAQLVGYDRDGREVYEGDTVVGELAVKHCAKLRETPVLKFTRLKEAQS